MLSSSYLQLPLDNNQYLIPFKVICSTYKKYSSPFNVFMYCSYANLNNCRFPVFFLKLSNIYRMHVHLVSVSFHYSVTHENPSISADLCFLILLCRCCHNTDSPKAGPPTYRYIYIKIKRNSSTAHR